MKQKSKTNSIKFLKKTIQKQKSGDNSTSIQVGQMTVKKGLTPEEAYNFALLIFKNNFPKLEKIAAETAKKRVEKFAREFIRRAHIENPKSLEFLTDPDGQFILKKALTGYARNGSQDHFELLIELLKQRAINNCDDLKKILTNESIKTTAKLTPNHFDLLSLLFLIKKSELGIIPDNQLNESAVSYQEIIDQSLADFTRFFKDLVFPIISNIQLSELDVFHLSYSGCGVLSSAETWPFEGIVSDISKSFYDHVASNTWFELKSKDPNFTFSSTNTYYKPRKEELFREALIMIDERFEGFLKIWGNFYFKEVLKGDINLRELNQIELTSVGRLIALANLKRRFNVELLDYFKLTSDSLFI